ncbi:MAG: hypothetical protein CMP06_08420 [Xanthomonadales bacterium]|nr:hypothetical protein [Xanthomonadales bacterium]
MDLADVRKRDDYAGGGEHAERAAIGTAKERQTFLLPTPGDEEFQFFLLGSVWVSPPPLWAMESPIVREAVESLYALVDIAEQRGPAHLQVRWFLRRLVDPDVRRYKPRPASIRAMGEDAWFHTARVYELMCHLQIRLDELPTELAQRIEQIAARVNRQRTGGRRAPRVPQQRLTIAGGTDRRHGDCDGLI